MTEEELRALYARLLEEPEGGDVAPPDPEELLAALEGEGSEEVRLRALDRALSSATGHGELELLRVLRDSGEGEAGERLSAQESTFFAPPLRRWAPLAVAAILVLALVTTLRQGGPGDAGVVRSGGGGPVLLLPQADGQVTLPATLVWSSLPGAVEYRVEVLDRSGGVLAEATLPASDTTWVLEGVATPASVQWWVRGILPTGTPSASRLQALRLR